MWCNKIQVFGLPRSGTNWLEWTLRNNFVDADYNITPEFINDVEGSAPYWTDLKHCYPTLKHSDYALVIFKEYDEWLESIKRKGWVLNVSQKTHQKYIDKGIKLGEDKVIVVEHKWAVKNYFQMLSEISDKFGVKLVDNPTQPTKRVDMTAGLHLMDEDFKM